MPLMVLLQDVFQKFTKSVKDLDPWNELVGLEALLVARARSAFLVHWFGSLIPLDGSSVRIGIVNLEALRQRYSLVMSKRRSQLSEGPSVLEPMAGIAGNLAGAMLTPLHFMSAMAIFEPYITKKLGTTTKKVLLKIGVILNWWAWGAFGLIAFVALAAGGPLLIAGFAAVPGTEGVQDFLTAATRIAKPLAEFWRQVSGPREKVKNPIVRAALGVLDKLAVMFPFFMQTVAFLIGKVGPLLDPMLHQFRALSNYINEVIELAKFTVTGLMDLFERWLDPKRSDSLPHYLDLVIEAVGQLLDFLADAISVRLIGDAREYFLRMGYGLTAYFADVKKWLVKRLLDILDENPLTKLVRATLKQIDALKPYFERLKAPSKDDDEEPGDFSKAISFQFEPASKDVDWLKGNVPEFRGPDMDFKLWSFKSTFPLIAPIMSPPTDPFADVRTKFPSRPRSIFAGEQKALDQTAIEQFQLPNVAMAVTQAHIDETRLRDALVSVASKVLPPEMLPYLKKLDDGMEKAGKALGQKPVPQDERTFPVLELPEEEKLRPVVGRLVVRVRGAARELTEEWTEGLRVTLLSQLYPMPAVEGGQG